MDLLIADMKAEHPLKCTVWFLEWSAQYCRDYYGLICEIYMVWWLLVTSLDAPRFAMTIIYSSLTIMTLPREPYFLCDFSITTLVLSNDVMSWISLLLIIIIIYVFDWMNWFGLIFGYISGQCLRWNDVSFLWWSYKGEGNER